MIVAGARKRIGLFGGTFNPLHMGHINALATVRQRLNLDKVYIIPAAQNPHKAMTESPSPEHRLEILRVGLQDYSDFAEVDDQEIKRGGDSFTIDTVKNYAETVEPQELYVIIGLDQFEEFDTWKDFEKILTIANLVVVSRPGHNLPFGADDLPKGIQPLVAAFDRQFIALTTGRSIEFIRLQDSDISATDVRKRLRTGRSLDRHLSIPVEEYIRTHGLYAPLRERIADYEEFTRFCGDILAERKAINPIGFDLRKLEKPTEFTIVASGTSTRQTSALAENLVQLVKEEYNVLPQSVEGLSEGRWVLLDYGSLIVHLFYDYVRQEYRIEELWKAGQTMEFKAATAAANP
jgi:nicotinate-nucleotide adenylyltransferase